MKPGNSAEDKTLTTGKQREERARWQQPEQLNLWDNPDGRRSPTGGGKSWTRGESDTDRESTQWMEQGAQKAIGGGEFHMGAEAENRRGHQPSGSGDNANHPRPSLAEDSHGGSELKVVGVMKRVYDRRRLVQAWQQVRANAGAAGVDNMTVEAFGEREDEFLSLIHDKLKAGTYRFKPAKRVLIPKPGSSKKRKLGIPVVMDRVVSQSLHAVLTEISEPDFSGSNFGFRRGKSQHQAIRHVREAVMEGYEWCASLDIQSFFDEIPHNLILKLIRQRIRDERLVTLIVRVLKAGVAVDGVIEKTDQGCPQGSPVSPVLSNIVLNELDQELERRGHRFSRWADDFVILLRTERAALRVMEGITRFLEEELGLRVNRDKSRVAPIKDVEFLGFQILRGQIRVSTRARKRFVQEVRSRTRRNNGLSMHQVIGELNEYLEGWVGYYRIQEFRKIFQELDGFIRSRLRSMQLKKWKKPAKFQRMMIRAGAPVYYARRTWVRMKAWQSVMRREVRFVLSLEWFRRQGLVFLHDFAQRNLKLEFAR